MVNQLDAILMQIVKTLSNIRTEFLALGLFIVFFKTVIPTLKNSGFRMDTETSFKLIAEILFITAFIYAYPTIHGAINGIFNEILKSAGLNGKDSLVLKLNELSKKSTPFSFNPLNFKNTIESIVIEFTQAVGNILLGLVVIIDNFKKFLGVIIIYFAPIMIAFMGYSYLRVSIVLAVFFIPWEIFISIMGLMPIGAQGGVTLLITILMSADSTWKCAELVSC